MQRSERHSAEKRLGTALRITLLKWLEGAAERGRGIMTRAPTSKRLSRTFLLSGLVVSACHSDPAEPETTPRGVGALQVSVQSIGELLGVVGYEVLVDGDRQSVLPNQTLKPRVLSVGTHVVRLEHVSETCVVNGENPRTVQVPMGQILDVGFQVECFKTGIAVTTHSTGVDVPDRFEIILEDPSFEEQLFEINANDSRYISPYPAGTFGIRLDLLSEHCTAAGPSSVTVVSRQVTPVHFEVTCASPPTRKDRIAYVSATSDQKSWIRLVYPDGSGDVLLTSGGYAAWSHDRTKLLVSDTKCVYDFDDITIADCSGGLVLIDPETRRMTPVQNGDDAFESTFAPDGNAVAFVKWRGGTAPFALVTLKLDGSPPQELTIPGCISLWHPAWSPDGSRFALNCATASESHVCIVNVDGTGATHFVSNFGYSGYAAWSPDGSKIAFYEDGHLKVMSAAGHSVTQLTLGWAPSWSPDGTKIVFADRDGLYTINADGSMRTRLTTGTPYSPVWRP